MGLAEIRNGVTRGLSGAKDFLGRAWHGGVKLAQGIDQYAGIARGMIRAVAPVVGAMAGGPASTAVGATPGGGMKALGAYDRLKTEAMNHSNQMGSVVAAAQRDMGVEGASGSCLLSCEHKRLPWH